MLDRQLDDGARWQWWCLLRLQWRFRARQWGFGVERSENLDLKGSIEVRFKNGGHGLWIAAARKPRFKVVDVSERGLGDKGSAMDWMKVATEVERWSEMEEGQWWGQRFGDQKPKSRVQRRRRCGGSSLNLKQWKRENKGGLGTEMVWRWTTGLVWQQGFYWWRGFGRRWDIDDEGVAIVGEGRPKGGWGVGVLGKR